MNVKELIVAEIITPLEIRKGVGSQALCQLEEFGVILRTLEKGRDRLSEIARIECHSRIDGFRPEAHTLSTENELKKQLARLLPKPPTVWAALRLKKVANWNKRNHALLSLG